MDGEITGAWREVLEKEEAALMEGHQVRYGFNSRVREESLLVRAYCVSQGKEAGR